MGLSPPGSPTVTPLLGPEAFPCRPATGDEGYVRYGVGPMRRGGLEREELEPDHITILGKGANFHGARRVTDGDTIEMEMDEDYFSPTILRGRAGAEVTLELENEGVREHTFTIVEQGIDLVCGVRAREEVDVVFPGSGILLFTCTFGKRSGMLGGLEVAH
jgi:plastocyanin